MKNLLACLAILAAFNVSAQVDGFQLPYNPDVEPDGYIGVGDVLNLLAMFGQQWNASDIYLNDDSTTMVMHVGQVPHMECLAVCSQLQGNWRLASLHDYAIILDEILSFTGTSYPGFWYRRDDGLIAPTGNGYSIYLDGTGGYTYTAAVPSTSYHCYCSTHERPKVEYSTCQGSDSAFDLCCQTKVQAGWYPLGGISLDQIGAKYQKQAFWRWAD